MRKSTAKNVFLNFATLWMALAIAKSISASSDDGINKNPQNNLAKQILTIHKGESFNNLQNTRVDYPSFEFSIDIPDGWDVQTDYQGSVLIMQPNRPTDPEIYSENIQIFSFSSVDGTGATADIAFKNWLQREVHRNSVEISNYEFTQSTEVATNSGIPANFYYTQFNVKNRELMQAILLVAAENKKYLVVYTDLKEHFNGKEKEQYLNLAWNTIASLDLKNPNYGFKGFVLHFGAPIVTGILLLGFIGYIRHVRASRYYKRLSANLEIRDEELPKSIHKIKAEKRKSQHPTIPSIVSERISIYNNEDVTRKTTITPDSMSAAHHTSFNSKSIDLSSGHKNSQELDFDAESEANSDLSESSSINRKFPSAG